MGYYTDFELMVDTPDITDIQNRLEAITKYEFYRNGRTVLRLNDAKWYQHVSDMRELSSFFPDLIFTLSGVGEEKEDMWREYYKNGKCQREDAKITFDPFDESKLI